MIDGLTKEILDLARAQTRPRFESTPAPQIDRAVSACRVESREALLTMAIESLTVPANVTTAEILFGSHPRRWELALGERRKLAGREVGFNPESFRKKNSDGVSDYERLAQSVAVAIMDHVGEAEAEADTEPEEPVDGVPLQPTTHPWRRPAVALLLVGLLVAGIAGFAIARLSTTTDEVAGVTATSAPASSTSSLVRPAAPPPLATLTDRPIPASTDGCNIPVGAAVNPGAIVIAAVGAIHDEYERMGGTDIVGCPAYAAAQWQDFWVQTFVGTSELPQGSIISRADMPQALWLEQSLVEAYQRTASSQLPNIAGPPVSFEGTGTNPTAHLTSGGLVVAQQAGGPAFWIPVEAIDDWGGPDGVFGLPMTDVNYVDSELTQQYERGQMAMTDDEQLVEFIADASDIEREVAGMDLSPPGIMRTFDSTAWWIDEDGMRRWIPSVEVWECVGGDSAVLAQEIPGWVIGGMYPLGPTMTCDDVVPD